MAAARCFAPSDHRATQPSEVCAPFEQERLDLPDAVADPEEVKRHNAMPFPTGCANNPEEHNQRRSAVRGLIARSSMV